MYTDPTNRLKAKLILTLKRIKRETNMGESMYRTMYPTSFIAPKFYGLPKIHKTGTPLRPIVSCRGLVTYGVAKVTAKVLKPLVGRLPHHIQSTSDFVNNVRGGYSPPRRVPQFLQCYRILHLCTHRSSS